MMPTNTAPQAVSRRYAHNLLVRGSNKVFELESVTQQVAKTRAGLACGVYYEATVKRSVGFEPGIGEGLTPVAAIIAALTHLGVTFR